MLQGMERIIVVDSIVLPKHDLLSAYSLSESAGTIAWNGTMHQSTHYTGAFGDYRIFPSTQGLCSSLRFGDQWTESMPLSIENSDTLATGINYPYLLSDGMTLYFAQESKEGLGGLDIYMTRLNPATHTYYRPENIGLPYNSTANDYLLAIDEEAGIGYFASDRRQPADSVCVYYFMPNALREGYENDTLSTDRLLSLARLESIADTWCSNSERAQEGLQRLAAHRQHLQDLREQADRRANSAKGEAIRSLAELEESLTSLRRQWHGGNHTEQLRQLIVDLEEKVFQKRKNMKMIGE